MCCPENLILYQLPHFLCWEDTNNQWRTGYGDFANRNKRGVYHIYYASRSTYMNTYFVAHALNNSDASFWGRLKCNVVSGGAETSGSATNAKRLHWPNTRILWTWPFSQGQASKIVFFPSVLSYYLVPFSNKISCIKPHNNPFWFLFFLCCKINIY